MPQSKQWAYVLHQAYGDIPPVTFYDDNTLDAFTSHSTWAFAERDDPMTSSRNEVQSTGNDDSENEKEEDNEDDEEEDGNGDPLQKKHIDQGCLPVYTNLTDGIGWLLDSFVGEIKSFKKSVKLSHQLNNNTENEIRRLMEKGSFTESEANMTKEYVSRLQKGTRKWSQLVRDQIKRQEIELFKDFKGKINDAVLKEYGNNLDDMLEDHKINLMKRSSIHTENGINGQTLNNIHTLLKRTLADDHGTITAKRHIIAELRHKVKQINTRCF